MLDISTNSDTIISHLLAMIRDLQAESPNSKDSYKWITRKGYKEHKGGEINTIKKHSPRNYNQQIYKHLNNWANNK